MNGLVSLTAMTLTENKLTCREFSGAARLLSYQCIVCAIRETASLSSATRSVSEKHFEMLAFRVDFREDDRCYLFCKGPELRSQFEGIGWGVGEGGRETRKL